jgi:hypothetical protein
MKVFKIVLALSLLILAVTSITVYGQEGEARRPTREKWDLISAEVRVEEVDKENRELVLRGPEGDLTTLEADESVERFDEIEPGDIIMAEYWVYLKAEFRDPTPEEMKEPLVVLAEAAKADLDMPPAAVVAGVVKAVVTIEIINRPDMVVTVKGPRGNYVSIPAYDPVLLTELNVGEVIVLTYAEALALELEKVDTGD